MITFQRECTRNSLQLHLGRESLQILSKDRYFPIISKIFKTVRYNDISLGEFTLKTSRFESKISTIGLIQLEEAGKISNLLINFRDIGTSASIGFIQVQFFVEPFESHYYYYSIGLTTELNKICPAFLKRLGST